MHRAQCCSIQIVEYAIGILCVKAKSYGHIQVALSCLGLFIVHRSPHWCTMIAYQSFKESMMTTCNVCLANLEYYTMHFVTHVCARSMSDCTMWTFARVSTFIMMMISAMCTRYTILWIQQENNCILKSRKYMTNRPHHFLRSLQMLRTYIN